MHAAVWTTPSYLPATTPGFLAHANPASQRPGRQYSHDILDHYKNQIKLYNAFNEPDGGQAYQFTLDELVNLVGSSLQGAKKGDPNTLGFVNISMPIFRNTWPRGEPNTQCLTTCTGIPCPARSVTPVQPARRRSSCRR